MTTPRSAAGTPTATGVRRRASHSMDAVMTASVALLDEAGESALTFRALAERLGGGVGSIYWYVSSKDELLDRATDHVLAQVLSTTDRLGTSSDPIDDLRAIAALRTDGGRSIEGAIVGKALYARAFTLPEALAAVRDA